MTFQTQLVALPEVLQRRIFHQFLTSTFLSSPLSTAEYNESLNSLKISIKATCSRAADEMAESIHEYMKHIRWFQHNWGLPKTVRFHLDGYACIEGDNMARYVGWLEHLCKPFRRHEIYIELAVPIFAHVPPLSREPVWREYTRAVSTLAAHWSVNGHVTAYYCRGIVMM